MARILFDKGLSRAHLRSLKSRELHITPWYLDFARRSSRLYFSSEKAMLSFHEEGTYPLSDGTIDFYQDVLGLYLGYPEKATKDFMNKDTDVCVMYKDFSFVCSYTSLSDCIKWCVDQYGGHFDSFVLGVRPKGVTASNGTVKEVTAS